MTDPPIGAVADPQRDDPEAPLEGRLRCDFCGEEAATVRRIALDGEYERLRTPHVVRYACAPCSDRKERERTGRGGGSRPGGIDPSSGVL